MLAHKADIGLGFDGDGDRCGVVDNHGDEIFADKIGVMLARDLSKLHPNSTFVVDVKSTGLYVTDPVLQKNGVKADYWKTGHSYMKRRTHELGALAGFEKSGHYFFNKPFGRGYDDGLISALAICDMMDRSPDKKMSELKDALPKTWGSPTMSPHCADEKKYGIVDAVVKHFETAQAKGDKVIGQPIRDLVTVNGDAGLHPSMTAPGAWYARRRTSLSLWWWSRARLRKKTCAPCSRRSTTCCARILTSAPIIRRSSRTAIAATLWQPDRRNRVPKDERRPDRCRSRRRQEAWCATPARTVWNRVSLANILRLSSPGPPALRTRSPE